MITFTPEQTRELDALHGRLKSLFCAAPEAEVAQLRADAVRLDFLEAAARRSQTGISFDWVPSVEGEPSGFRFMRRFFVGEPVKSMRGAIDRAISSSTGEDWK